MKKKKAKVTLVEQYAEYAEIGDMYTSRWKKLDLLIPSNFRMLCAILQVKPEKILMDLCGCCAIVIRMQRKSR
ncbi:hypothetical protein IFO69_11130 [Echinicola sp. CAU 1574]|uniref:Uncharacterized protein n=1 Tax=Echinicola arenosa TaxID=2774144 RepID=A0ABR9AKF7_9BACT|nr:hypothetical protein [Echinicola arenosa]MBD8489299.1 hypothetical protein [Echinicola arenosa]